MPEDDEDEDEVYEFVAAGEHSCERCAALNGSQWSEPPNPPHAHCECEVQVRPRVPRMPKENCEDTTWSLQPLTDGAVDYDAGGETGVEWGFQVTIDCWDGGSWDFEIWVDLGKASDWDMADDYEAQLEGFVWNEVYDEVETVIARVCRPCTPELVS